MHKAKRFFFSSTWGTTIADENSHYRRWRHYVNSL